MPCPVDDLEEIDPVGMEFGTDLMLKDDDEV
jgi:hypothetical protein